VIPGRGNIGWQKLPEEVIETLESDQKKCMLATVNEDETLNLVPNWLAKGRLETTSWPTHAVSTARPRGI